MSLNYIAYHFKIAPLQPGSEILIAELGEAGFESFVEEEDGITAYIQQVDWRKDILKEVRIISSDAFEISYRMEKIEQVNWNLAWEKNFEAINVNEQCVVRAPFHPKTDAEYEIIIEPKMSFGTGHHETTFMMLQFILENDFKGKSVLDMGCGTAVLAILAKMRGASMVDAIDIDEWCYENSLENTMRNGCDDISVILGDATAIPKQKYHTVIANINRNILLNDLETYKESMIGGGALYLSGFYAEDLPIISDACNKLGFSFVEKKEKNKWIAAKFVN
jgi:ribosomal protein L11 methyltransferase